MTVAEKAEFIRNLTDTVRDALIAAVPNMPESWDGHELRALIADTFAAEVSSVIGRRIKPVPHRYDRRRSKAFRWAAAELGRI